MTEPKTGIFELSVEVPPGATKTERDFKFFQLLNEMTWKIQSLVADGRGYELRARISGKWEPGEPPAAERLRLDFSLILLDALTAEVGEWVKRLPHWVPDCKRTVILREGHGEATGWLFQKGDLGWQRVE
jgi:hypothetical protein